MSGPISKTPITWKVNAYSWVAAHRLADDLGLPPWSAWSLPDEGYRTLLKRASF